MGAVILLLIAAAVWAGSVWFFWRSGAWLPYYLIGSAGSAILIVVGCRELPIQDWLQAFTAESVHFASAFIGVKTSTTHLQAGDLLVVGFSHGHQWTDMTIGLECSGLLEGAALCGLIAFFPAYSMKRRAGIMGIALLATFIANIIRVMVIVGVVAYVGQAWLQFAHVVLGRVVFFALAIGIYWFAVTRPTLRAVGSRIRSQA
ncbi:MAG: archaeosortase/exosortase family protein [Tepidiformaceae bacterium]